jgi:predicted transcriptional regulator
MQYGKWIKTFMMERCVVGIRLPGNQGIGVAKASSTVWCPSMATLAAVLSEDNQVLLRLIREKRPKSLTALAELSGRQACNLARSLRMMEGYGLVELKENVSEIEPIVLATEFLILLGESE